MNLLSLEQFRQILHYNPFHFWGWKLPGATASTSACNEVVKEYSWQVANAVGRAEIRQAIISAEKILQDYLGYSVLPHFVEETLDYARHYDQRLWPRNPIDATGRWKSVHVSQGFVQAVGVEQKVLLATVAANATFPYVGILPALPYFVYLDIDGDNIVDTFEVAVATTLTDTSEIALYFSATDRLDSEEASDRWRIQPISVKISGGQLTIRGRSWMLAQPVLYEGIQHNDLDPADKAKYVQSLEVYRRVCSSAGQTVDTAQGKFVWETLPYPDWWGIFPLSFADGTTDPAAQAYSVARVGIRDAKSGELIPGEAIFDSATGKWNMTVPPWIQGVTRPPERVVIRYFAGYPADVKTLQMASEFQVADAHLAMAVLDNRIAACDEAMRELGRWQREMTQIGNREELYKISDADLDCPFGTRSGAIDAWRRVRFRSLLHGVSGL